MLATEHYSTQGHLSNLAENTLIGAVNDEDGAVNSAYDCEGEGDARKDSIPGIAKRYRDRKQPWMLVADHNYGESRCVGRAAVSSLTAVYQARAPHESTPHSSRASLAAT